MLGYVITTDVEVGHRFGDSRERGSGRGAYDIIIVSKNKRNKTNRKKKDVLL